jgi:predicted MFS family arabinose efflux permease
VSGATGTTDDGGPATAPGAATLLAFMWGAYFLNYCDRQAVFAMFPALRADLGMDDASLGLVGAIFLWVYAIGCPVAGHLGDRMSRRLLAVASLVVWSLVTVATGFVAGGAAMLALRAAMGISESLFMPTAVALVADAHAPRARSRAVAILTTAQIAGTVGGSVFGGWMADAGRWRQAFLILGLVGIVYALPYFLFLSRGAERRGGRAREAAPLWTLFSVPSYVALCAVFPCFVFGLWLIYGWLPDFLRTKFSLSLADAAWNATIWLQAMSAVGLLGGGVLSDRLYRRSRAARQWVLVTSLLASAPCLWCIGAAPSLATTRLAAAGFGLSCGLFMGNIFPAAFEVVRADSRAGAVGVLNLFGGLVSGFGALFGGLVKSSIGIDGLLSICALAWVAAALLLVAATRRFFAADHARAACPGAGST